MGEVGDLVRTHPYDIEKSQFTVERGANISTDRRGYRYLVKGV